jgi:hypothetical protein
LVAAFGAGVLTNNTYRDKESCRCLYCVFRAPTSMKLIHSYLGHAVSTNCTSLTVGPGEVFLETEPMR